MLDKSYRYEFVDGNKVEGAIVLTIERLCEGDVTVCYKPPKYVPREKINGIEYDDPLYDYFKSKYNSFCQVPDSIGTHTIDIPFLIHRVLK